MDIAVQDYLAELSRLTNIPVDQIKLLEPSSRPILTGDVYDYKMLASGNPDLQISKLNMDKARLGIKMARQGNLLDLGLVAGYYHQQGNPMLPSNSPYLGISLTWNLQNLFSNKQVEIQRKFQLKQAEASLAYTQQPIIQPAFSIQVVKKFIEIRCAPKGIVACRIFEVFESSFFEINFHR